MRNRIIPILLIVALAAFIAAIFVGLRKEKPTQQVQTQPEQQKSNSLFPDNKLPKNPDGSLRISAKSTGWYPVGTGEFVLEVSGQINIGSVLVDSKPQPVIVPPTGWSRLGDDTALVKGLPFGAVVGRIGNGKPFLVGNNRKFQTGNEMAYIAINDSDYSDNSGEFIVNKIVTLDSH